MVVSPVSSTEPALYNVTDIKLNDCADHNEHLANKLNNRGVKDHAFTIQRDNMSNGKDNYALDFDCIEKAIDNKLNSSADIKAEPDIVKKVAAGLKSPNGQKNKTDMSLPNLGGGTLSSGCSIVTISSVANSDPDPEFHNNTDGFGNSAYRHERWYQTTLQVAVPFFIAGIGTIGAGLVLENVKDWPVFRTVSQLIILVPSLLGLKGNLDMCLASRLCTQANLGNMHEFREIVKMIIGNIALVQIQAIVAAILVSIFAIISAIAESSEYSFEWNHCLLLAASSVSTATSSCFILDFVMIVVIIISYRCKMNPDNLATPLAASFGDVVSISMLSTIASALFERMTGSIPWILYIILGCYLLILPFWIYVVLKNKYTRNVLASGWIPVLSALFISGCGGLVLSGVVDHFTGFAIFNPIINGIGGNLVSVQASRISTTLHQTTIMGILPPHSKIFIAPWKALFTGRDRTIDQRSYVSIGRKSATGSAKEYGQRLRNKDIVAPIHIKPENAESLWPVGVFIPPIDINDLGYSSQESRHATPDFSNGLEYHDPYLLTGEEAMLAVKYLYDQGELFYDDIPHERALLKNQEERRRNGLHDHILRSLRLTSSFSRKS